MPPRVPASGPEPCGGNKIMSSVVTVLRSELPLHNFRIEKFEN